MLHQGKSTCSKSLQLIVLMLFLIGLTEARVNAFQYPYEYLEMNQIEAGGDVDIRWRLAVRDSHLTMTNIDVTPFFIDIYMESDVAVGLAFICPPTPCTSFGHISHLNVPSDFSFNNPVTVRLWRKNGDGVFRIAGKNVFFNPQVSPSKREISVHVDTHYQTHWWADLKSTIVDMPRGDILATETYGEEHTCESHERYYAQRKQFESGLIIDRTRGRLHLLSQSRHQEPCVLTFDLATEAFLVGTLVTSPHFNDGEFQISPKFQIAENGNLLFIAYGEIDGEYRYFLQEHRPVSGKIVDIKEIPMAELVLDGALLGHPEDHHYVENFFLDAESSVLHVLSSPYATGVMGGASKYRISSQFDLDQNNLLSQYTIDSTLYLGTYEDEALPGFIRASYFDMKRNRLIFPAVAENYAQGVNFVEFKAADLVTGDVSTITTPIMLEDNEWYVYPSVNAPAHDFIFREENQTIIVNRGRVKLVPGDIAEWELLGDDESHIYGVEPALSWDGEHIIGISKDLDYMMVDGEQTWPYYGSKHRAGTFVLGPFNGGLVHHNWGSRDNGHWSVFEQPDMGTIDLEVRDNTVYFTWHRTDDMGEPYRIQGQAPVTKDAVTFDAYRPVEDDSHPVTDDAFWGEITIQRLASGAGSLTWRPASGEKFLPKLQILKAERSCW